MPGASPSRHALERLRELPRRDGQLLVLGLEVVDHRAEPRVVPAQGTVDQVFLGMVILVGIGQKVVEDSREQREVGRPVAAQLRLHHVEQARLVGVLLTHNTKER